MTIVLCSFGAFEQRSRRKAFTVDVLRWTPIRFAHWIFERDRSPGMMRLRENRECAHEVAAKLIEEKRQELKDGTLRRDVLTLLGSSCSAFLKLDRLWNLKSFS